MHLSCVLLCTSNFFLFIHKWKENFQNHVCRVSPSPSLLPSLFYLSFSLLKPYKTSLWMRSSSFLFIFSWSSKIFCFDKKKYSFKKFPVLYVLHKKRKVISNILLDSFLIECNKFNFLHKPKIERNKWKKISHR